RRRHTRFSRDWSSDVCSSDLVWKEGNIMRNAIKKIALTVTAVAAIGGLAACGDSSELGNPSNTDSPTTQLNPDDPLTQEQLEQKIGRASCRERGESAGVDGCV